MQTLEHIGQIETTETVWGVRLIKDTSVEYVECSSSEEAKKLIESIDLTTPAFQPRLVKATVVKTEWEFTN